MTEKEGILLSDRERDVHTLKQAGLTHGEIADRLDVSTSTIDEYSRRIANKRDRAVETLVFLNEESPLFDAGLIEEESSGADWLICRRCECRERVGKTNSHCLNCGSEHADYNTDEWYYLASGWWTSDARRGWCETCISEYFEEAKSTAVEKGRLPCFHSDHSTHQLSGNALEECRPAYVPLTDEQLREINAAYRDRRQHVCPECRRPESEIDKATIEAPEPGTLSPDPPMTETTGLRCGCGWEGFRRNMSFVKR